MAFPVSEDKIIAAETSIGWPLPKPLRTRLLADNGGSVHAKGDPDDIWWLHPVWDNTDRKRMGRTANHILRQTGAARIEHTRLLKTRFYRNVVGV